MKNVQFVICILILSIMGCKPKLTEIDIPNQKYSLVINALLVKDSLITLKLGKNVGILLKDKVLDLQKAQMKIRINNSVEEMLSIKSFNSENAIDPFSSASNDYVQFISNQSIIKNGDKINITTNAKGFDSENAEIKFDIENIEGFVYDLRFDTANYSEFKVDIIDNPNIENGFIIELFRVDSNKIFYPIRLSAQDDSKNNDDSFNTDATADKVYFDNKLIFSDKYNSNNGHFVKTLYFNNITYGDNIVIGYDTIRYLDGSVFISPKYSNIRKIIFESKTDLIVKITQIDVHFLKYAESASAQNYNIGNIFAEPVFVYSNLSSKKGIVGMASKKLIYFK